jgi:hypothetical protein
LQPPFGSPYARNRDKLLLRDLAKCKLLALSDIARRIRELEQNVRVTRRAGLAPTSKIDAAQLVEVGEDPVSRLDLLEV